MKRKNPDFNKARKFIRKTKFSENLLSSSYLYMKLFFLWFLVVVSDFLIEFRFEYLWPFYLCARNVYDIFKYQGFAFSAFFVFITLASNAICFFLMPVQWLFFTASTYVWFQYVWNSEKGICLQTFTVWLIFVYVEATVRLKELKNMPTHLDFCRPMAAWCIGYPFVSLGFGFKKYLNHKIMLQRQKEVQIENEHTFLTINRLHIEHSNDSLMNNHKDEDLSTTEELNNNEQIDESDDEKRNITNYDLNDQTSSNIVLIIEQIVKLTSIYLNAIIRRLVRLIANRQSFIKQQSSIESFEINSSQQLNHHIISSYQENHQSTPQTLDACTGSHQTQSASVVQQPQLQSQLSTSQQSDERELTTMSVLDKERLKKIKQENKNEIKKLKSDLQTAKQTELEYKDKFNKMQASRNELKFQCSKLQHDNTALQTKLQNFVNTKQQDKNSISELEKKLQDERKAKTQLEKQLTKYSKLVECGEACKQIRSEFENTINKLHDELRSKDAQIIKLNGDNVNDKQLLMTALEKMQDRTHQLDTSLRKETRLKLELFSVLGETRRQLEMNQILLLHKSKEVEELNCKISELMAVLPMSGQDPYSGSIFLSNFMGTGNNELNKQTQNMDTSGSSLLKNNLLNSNNNLQSQQQSPSTQNIDSNNLSNNSNTSVKTSSSSLSTKGSLSDWKNLNSLESTSGCLTLPPKNCNEL